MHGMDPRIVERWLASGRDRVAIGWITPAMNDSIRETRINSAYALQRAAYVSLEGLSDAATAAAVVSRYREAQLTDPEVATFVRVVATCELLQLERREDGFYVDLVQRAGGLSVPAHSVAAAERGRAALLIRGQDGLLRARDGLRDLIDQELNRRIDPGLFDALVGTIDSGSSLAAMARSLALHGQLGQADIALARAAVVQADDPAVTETLLWLKDIEDGLERGPTGATLARSGGHDFEEPAGPEQERAIRDFSFPGDDPVFDPTLPDPEKEGRRQRFYRRTVQRAFLRVGTLMLLDALAVLVACAAALSVRSTTQGALPGITDGRLWKLWALTALVFWLSGSAVGLYRAASARARPHLVFASSLVVSVVAGAAFFVVDVSAGSVGALPTMLAVAFTLSLACRSLYDGRSRRWVRDHRLAPRVLLLGSPAEARAYGANMASTIGRPVQPVAYLWRDREDRDPFRVGTYEDLEQRLHELHIAEVAIVDHSAPTAEKRNLVERAQGFGVDVRFVASDTEVILGAVGRLGDLGLVHIPGALITPERLEFKRVADWLVVAATFWICLLVIAAYCAYSVVRRPGQPLLVQAERVGLGQIPFAMLQLRTRTVLPDRTRGVRATGRVEDFFERSGLDELPQIANVLRGEMALVGPRALSRDGVRRLKLDQRRTLVARPGMTGRWKLVWPTGASEDDMRAVDLDYLRRWRVALDLEILLMTVLGIFSRKPHQGDTEIARRQGDWSAPQPSLPT